MKYILDKLQAQEDIANILQDTNNLRLTKQIKVEASLLGILGYLWGLHYTGLNSDHQCDAVQLSRKPTIGQIVQLIRTLDTQNSISRKVRAVIERYPNLRNEFLGHGYLYTSSISSFSDDMDAIYDAFMTSGIPIFQHNCSLVLVLAKDGSVYKGIRFSPGINLAPWMISSGEFVCGDTYFLVEDRYVRSSPFLSLSKDGEAYIFNRIEDALTGAIKTMNVLTGAQSRLYEQQFTAGQVQIGFNRFKSPNGTVYNAFQANFKAYIPVNNIKALILKFARGNNAACATVWGHGGMGKTAAVQEAILELRNKDHKVFDYIVFVSAKDRLYDYEAANIITTQPTCRTLEDMQVIMREVLFADPTAGDDIIDTNFLLVVDDFETFCAEERHKIVSFIRTFNATKNKAIITTRANIIIGEEIPTNELDQEQTERFLYDYMRTVFPDYPILQQEIKDVGEALIRSSGGRPLFILQIAHLVPQIGLSAAAGRLITSGDSAKKFLFDRIYDSYLSTQLSRDVYCVISRLVGGAELRNMISKVAFLLNLEANMEVVQKSFDELAKIRVIKLDEDGRFFEVYSIELIEFMRAQYDLRESVFKRTCESRLKLIASSSEKDVDSALLEQANSKRLFGSQKEVTDAYRMLLNRPNCSTKIRRDALLNLVAYLVTIKGNRAEGIRIIREYVEIFKDDSLYVKMYATYLWQESGEGDRQEALEMLRRYVALGRDLSSTLDLEIVGMFMTFWSNDFLAQWQECKDTRYSKPSEDYQRERQALLYEGNQIYLLSNRIFPLIEHKDFTALPPGARQNLATGFYRVVDVMVRIKKIERAMEYCGYFDGKTPNVDFKSKRQWILSFNK